MFYAILQVQTSENCIFLSYFIINNFDKLIIIHKKCINCLHKLKNKLIQTDSLSILNDQPDDKSNLRIVPKAKKLK
jgi:hypothetical protein